MVAYGCTFCVFSIDCDEADFSCLARKNILDFLCTTCLMRL
jgi:hypothetical protein